MDRSWQLSKGPTTKDWAYTLFQWDNQFASFITALDQGTYAHAITKHKTTVEFLIKLILVVPA